MNKQVQKKTEQTAVKLAKRLGIDPEKESKFFKLYASYKSTASELKEAYKHFWWLDGMMSIDGSTCPPALIRYSEYSYHLDKADKKVDALESKIGRILKSMSKIVDFQKIIDDSVRALKPQKSKPT